METEDVDRIINIAVKACYDATLAVHRAARVYGTLLIIERDGVPEGVSPLSDKEVRERLNSLKGDSMLMINM
ncbi:hypothetical protein SAMN05216361_4376 [Marisediminitalea aggregata]|uniref:Uncharacterized protein n=1 Tax=Marisediminitalea aggregata TaxID=634436 RepID=A0A1M5SBQ7_9ALTE|nr:hypothetical protein [Marisediminitalea aggregata]SHH35880.1 hypothetical protein SAMN05216361_4376 [Marisediminitalea aggregata]